MPRPFAWSYSALDAYELCPKKFWAEKIGRIVKEKRSSVGDYGAEAHKHFENRLIKNKPLPLDLRHHENVLSKLATAPGEGMPEQKLALNRDFKLTGFFDDDVWVRGVIDFAKVNGRHLLVIDHKFGRMKEGFDQVDLMIVMMFCVLPEIETATGAYYWAKEKKVSRKKYQREDAPGIWNSFLPRVNRMKEAKKKDDFPARPNFLCKRHCLVKSCPYNGV